MQVRLLTSDDAQVYNPFILRGVKEHAELFRISEQDVLESLDPLLAESSDDFTFGAFSQEGELLGVVSFARETREKFQHKGLLYRMYVASEAAARGIGRALIRSTIERARMQHGLEQILLTVLAENIRAKRLYESEGFEVFSLEPKALKAGDDYFDEQQMVLYL